MADFARRVSSSEAKCDELTSGVAAKADSIGSRLAQEAGRLSAMESQLGALHGACRSAEEAKTQSREAEKAVSSGLNSIESQMADFARRVSSSEAKCDELTSGVAAKADSIGSRLAQEAGRLSAMESQLGALHGACRSAEEAKTQSREAELALTGGLTAVEEQLSALSERIGSSDKLRAELVCKVTANAEGLESLHSLELAHFSEMGSRLDELRAACRSEADARKLPREAEKELASGFSTLEQQMGDLSSRFSVIEDMTSGVRTKVDSVESKLEQESVRLSSFELQLGELRAVWRSAEEARTQSREAEQTLTCGVNLLEQQFRDFATLFAASEMTREELSARLVETTERLDSKLAQEVARLSEEMESQLGELRAAPRSREDRNVQSREAAPSDLGLNELVKLCADAETRRTHSPAQLADENVASDGLDQRQLICGEAVETEFFERFAVPSPPRAGGVEKAEMVRLSAQVKVLEECLCSVEGALREELGNLAQRLDDVDSKGKAHKAGCPPELLDQSLAEIRIDLHNDVEAAKQDVCKALMPRLEAVETKMIEEVEDMKTSLGDMHVRQQMAVGHHVEMEQKLWQEIFQLAKDVDRSRENFEYLHVEIVETDRRIRDDVDLVSANLDRRNAQNFIISREAMQKMDEEVREQLRLLCDSALLHRQEIVALRAVIEGLQRSLAGDNAMAMSVMAVPVVACAPPEEVARAMARLQDEPQAVAAEAVSVPGSQGAGSVERRHWSIQSSPSVGSSVDAQPFVCEIFGSTGSEPPVQEGFFSTDTSHRDSASGAMVDQEEGDENVCPNAGSSFHSFGS